MDHLYFAECLHRPESMSLEGCFQIIGDSATEVLSKALIEMHKYPRYIHAIDVSRWNGEYWERLGRGKGIYCIAYSKFDPANHTEEN